MIERQENIAKIRALMSERKERIKFVALVMHFLEAKGLARNIAEEVALRALQKEKGSTPDALFSLLQEEIALLLKTKPLSVTAGKIALVGPTGVGKTTTLLKLASALRLEKSVALMTLDDEKGRFEKQVRRLSLPFFNQDRKQTCSEELILIDTPGCNYYEKNRVEQLAQLLSSFKDVQVHLTLSASAKQVDLVGAIHQFSSLNIQSLIFTKLDETLALGALVNLSSQVDIPLSFVTYGYPLPGILERADSRKIAHKILTHFNDESFCLLRDLASIGD